MQKIIWTCWFQGRAEAPELVQKCMQSWQDKNSSWHFCCLDADTIPQYIDLHLHVDLARQTITAASLSDIVRVLLLQKFGGVWVDATTYCNASLDTWLPAAARTGFFAFAKPAADRPIASWFIAAELGNILLDKWAMRTLRYWGGRQGSGDYFWFHRQFDELCSSDRDAFEAWRDVPKISADGPHSIQLAGMYEDFDAVRHKIDWNTPVFKLTYRLDADTATCLMARLLELNGKGIELSEPKASEAQAEVGAM